MTMVKRNVAELEGAALDWAVAVAAGYGTDINKMKDGDDWCGITTVPNAISPFLACVVGHKIGRSKRPYHSHYFYPSTVWSQGGPLVDKYQPDFSMMDNPDGSSSVEAKMMRDSDQDGLVEVYRAEGDTYLVAAMRVIVAAELGGEVEVPEVLAHG